MDVLAEVVRAVTPNISTSIGIRQELICEERYYCQSLGGRFGEVLDAGEITFAYDSERGYFVIRYFDHVLSNRGECILSRRLRSRRNLILLRAGGSNFTLCCERQHYRLAWWRTANDEINWRRFFDINDLAAIRVEDDEVFETDSRHTFSPLRRGLDRRLSRRSYRRPGAAGDILPAGCANGCRELERVRPAGAPRVAPISSWKKFWRATKAFRSDGMSTARRATISWTRRAHCYTTNAASDR